MNSNGRQTFQRPLLPIIAARPLPINSYFFSVSTYSVSMTSSSFAEGCPDEVNVHDFVDKELGKAIPYGVYDIGAQPQRSFHPEWNYTISPREPI